MKALKAAILISLAILPVRASSADPDPDGLKCYSCHYRLPSANGMPSFNEEIGRVCSLCHGRHHATNQRNSHPVDVRPPMPVPRDMPLDAGGRMSCVTCHTYHIGHDVKKGRRRFLLRREPGRAFCYSCHKKALFRPG